MTEHPLGGTLLDRNFLEHDPCLVALAGDASKESTNIAARYNVFDALRCLGQVLVLQLAHALAGEASCDDIHQMNVTGLVGTAVLVADADDSPHFFELDDLLDDLVDRFREEAEGRSQGQGQYRTGRNLEHVRSCEPQLLQKIPVLLFEPMVRTADDQTVRFEVLPRNLAAEHGGRCSAHCFFCWISHVSPWDSAAGHLPRCTVDLPQA